MTITTDRTAIPTIVLTLMTTPTVTWNGRLIVAVQSVLDSMTPENTDIDEFTLRSIKNHCLRDIPAIAGWSISKRVDAAAERFGF